MVHQYSVLGCFGHVFLFQSQHMDANIFLRPSLFRISWLDFQVWMLQGMLYHMGLLWHVIPLVLRKAVAEVSKIGNHREGEQL